MTARRPIAQPRSIALAGLCCVIAACTSLPAAHRYAPEISGVVLQAGQPVANARVRLAAGLTPEVEAALSDERGRFNVGPLTDYRFTVKQFGAAYFEYTVQVSVGGRPAASFEATGEGEPPRRVHLVCELGAADAPSSAGACRAQAADATAAAPGR